MISQIYHYMTDVRLGWSVGITCLLLVYPISGQALIAPDLKSDHAGHGVVGMGGPFIRFFERESHSLAAIDQALLLTDFYAEVRVLSISSDDSVVGPASGTGPTPTVGANLVSRVFRLAYVNDSLVISGYAGMIGGRYHYDHQRTIPIRYITVKKKMVVNARSLWEVLEPSLSSDVDMNSSWSSSLLRFDDAPPRGRGAASVIRRLGRKRISYAVEIVRLPKTPMRPRVADPRVGLRTTGSGRVIRFRLEKRDSTASVSDVVQPVIARIMESVPKQWIPDFKTAIEEWNSVFEDIGFRRAIKILTPEDPPPDDAAPQFTLEWSEAIRNGGRYASIRTDPRTGESLRAKITIFSSGAPPFHSLSTRYFPMLRLRDPHAGLMMADSITSLAIRATVLHEVGHVLGLNHNFQSGYSPDSLRDLGFIRRMGHAPSVMGYAIINFVAQVNDSVPFRDLLPRIGPYDRWALAWGYRPIPGAPTPEAELQVLEEWRAEQDSTPYLRPSVGRFQNDNPYSQPEIVGNDVLKSVAYGIRNLAHVTEVANSDLSPEHLAYLRSRWRRLFKLVPSVIGGVVPQPPYPKNINEIRGIAIDSSYQVQAIRFLLDRLFYGKDEFLHYMLPSRSIGDSMPVLFDRLLPRWGESQRITINARSELDRRAWRKSMKMHDIQREILDLLVKDRLPALKQQGEWSTLAAVCQELKALDRRFLVIPQDSLNEAAVGRLGAISKTTATAFSPSGICTRSP